MASEQRSQERYHIVCDPNPFCYGAVSALRAIAHALPEVQLTVLATGPVREQCDPSTFDRVIACDVKSPESVREHEPVLRSADLYLAISNNTNVELALRLDLPLVFVDILFWMKRRPTLAMRAAHSYLIENFPGVPETLARYRASVSHPRVVGPLIALSPPGPRQPSDPLLVNFGGAQSPDLLPGLNTCYPSSMTRLLRELLSELGWSPQALTLAMGEKAATRVRHEGAQGELQVETLPQRRYLELLARARQLLTAPGLNAPFEGFAWKVPTRFLPPQNLTQVCQLPVYQEQGLAPRGLNLTELYPDCVIDRQAPEAEGTALVLELVARFDTDPRARAQVRERVAEQLLQGPEAVARQLAAQEDFLARLGPPGAQEAAEEILRQLRARPPRREGVS